MHLQPWTRILLLFLLLSGCLPLAAQPKLTPYLAESSYDGVRANPAIIVCPGGSYSWLDMETEGTGVAQWLQKNGITAFVLQYRVQGVPAFISHYRLLIRGHQYPDALDDLQEAIRYVRSHATEYHIDPDRIGAMGFSAGGHLVASSAIYFKDEEERPDFVAPIYPVVTMNEPEVHKRSRRALLGEWRKHSQQWRDSLSLERHIRPDMPPVFLVNCIDDPIVRYRNSVLLDSALTQQGIPHVYHQYQTGGHGFGADPQKATEECIRWKEEFINWLKDFCNGQSL